MSESLACCMLSSYSRDIIRLVAVPQEVVATESSSMASRADVVVDAAGHAYRAYLTEKGKRKVVVRL